MGRQKSEGRLSAEQISEENNSLPPNKQLSDHALAKLLYANKPNLYNDVEHARSMIRLVHGKSGERARKEVTRTDLLKKMNPVYTEKIPEEYKAAQKRRHDSNKKRFIITYAQNNTPVHKEFWANILAYSKHINADIHVVLGRYKNPTSVFTTSNEEIWAKEIIPYSDANRHDMHKHLVILSDIKVQPTATLPLTSMEGISGLNSAIIGHTKAQFKTIPALEGYMPKILMTTGAVTLPNYTDSKAGKKGEFHHVFGFVIVEIKDDDVFYIRQVTALKNGSFTDLYHNVKDGEIRNVHEINAAILGDIHVGDHCERVNKQQKHLLSILKPRFTVIHDIFNGSSISHHEFDDPIRQYKREIDDSNNLQKEIDNMIEWVDDMKGFNLVFDSSNHNDWIDRFIKKADWKRNIKNAMTYMKCANILLSGKADNGLIAYFLKERFGKEVKVLGRNESFRVGDWELGQHGDIGTNGSRGGIQQYRSLSTKMVLGHSHTPSRTDGVLYVGTSTKLRVGYNIGASNWLNADVIIHKDGKAQHIIYVGNDKGFTTFRNKKA